jgi:hypothetical protein
MGVWVCTEFSQAKKALAHNLLFRFCVAEVAAVGRQRRRREDVFDKILFCVLYMNMQNVTFLHEESMQAQKNVFQNMYTQSGIDKQI